jgi:hypothetical protein
MRKIITRIAFLLAITATTLTACKKEDVPAPPPPPPTGDFAVKVKAAITVGDVVYDSIPATFTVSSWDRSGVMHQREVQLAAGTQTIYLPKAYTKYRIQLAKWGVTDERTILNNEVSESTTYVLGGSKAAKKLREEMRYVLRDGTFQLSGKRVFVYNNEGQLKEVENHYVDNSQDSQLYLATVDRFSYEGGKLQVIESVDRQGAPADGVVGFNSFTYNQHGKIAAMFYGDIFESSTAHIEYVPYDNHELVRVAFGIDNDLNGSRAEMKFAAGNRVEEKTIIPNYPTATRTFSFDGAINPFAHLKWPTINFANDSKNNVLEEHLDNTSIYLQHEYTYDADGFVKEVVKREINGSTNETRGVYKTVYIY